MKDLERIKLCEENFNYFKAKTEEYQKLTSLYKKGMDAWLKKLNIARSYPLDKIFTNKL